MQTWRWKLLDYQMNGISSIISVAQANGNEICLAKLKTKRTQQLAKKPKNERTLQTVILMFPISSLIQSSGVHWNN